MRLVVIPSWYPSPASPVAGQFIRTQAHALAALEHTVTVGVGLWGQGTSEIPLRHPSRAASLALRHMKSRNSETWCEGGVQYFQDNRLTFTRRLPFRHMGPMIEATRKNLRAAMKAWGAVDLVHAHVSYPAGYIASVVCSEMSIPYVLTEHMSPFPFEYLLSRGRPIKEIDKAFKESAQAIAVGPALAERIGAFGFERPIVIPNLINEVSFSIRNPSGSKFRFLTICGLNQQKGLDLLLQAWATWAPSPSECELVIAGDGPARHQLERLADQLGLANQVHWIGAVDPREVPSLLAQCHAFVLPSRHETFGVVLAEAAAAGMPLIATKCGGPETIVNPANGLLVEVEDVDGLAQALDVIRATWKDYDPDAIRRDCLERFGRRVIVDRLMTVYRRVIEQI